MSDFSSFYDSDHFQPVEISLDQLEQSIIYSSKPENLDEHNSLTYQLSWSNDFKSFSSGQNSSPQIKTHPNFRFIDEASDFQQNYSSVIQNNSNKNKQTPLQKPPTKTSLEPSLKQQKHVQKLKADLDQQEFIPIMEKYAHKYYPTQNPFQGQPIARLSNPVQNYVNQSLNISQQQKKSKQNFRTTKQSQRDGNLVSLMPVSRQIKLKENPQNKGSSKSLDLSFNDQWSWLLNEKNQRNTELQQIPNEKTSIFDNREFPNSEKKTKDILIQTELRKLQNSFQSKKSDFFGRISEKIELYTSNQFESLNRRDLESSLPYQKKRQELNLRVNDQKEQNIPADIEAHPQYKASKFVVNARIWSEMLFFCDFFKRKLSTPRQLLLLKQNVADAWNLMLSIFQMISKHLIKKKNYSYFVQAITQIQNFFGNPSPSQSIPKFGSNRIYELKYQLLLRLSQKNFAPSDLHSTIEKLSQHFFIEQKLFAPFIKFALRFFLKKYFQFAYASLTQNGKQYTYIDRVLECVDLLFKHGINEKIDNFLQIKTISELETMDSNKEQEIKRLVYLLEQISKSQIFFCRIFKQKSFPWLGVFTEPFIRMKQP